MRTRGDTPPVALAARDWPRRDLLPQLPLRKRATLGGPRAERHGEVRLGSADLLPDRRSRGTLGLGLKKLLGVLRVDGDRSGGLGSARRTRPVLHGLRPG